MKARIATFAIVIILLAGAVVFASGYYGSKADSAGQNFVSATPVVSNSPASPMSAASPALSAVKASPRTVVIPPPTTMPTNSFGGEGDDD